MTTPQDLELVTPPPPPQELLDAHEYLIYGYVLDDDYHARATVLFGAKNDIEGYKGCTIMYGALKQYGLMDHVMVNWGSRFINHGNVAILAVAHKEMGVVTPWPGKGKIPTEERLAAFEGKLSIKVKPPWFSAEPYTKPYTIGAWMVTSVHRYRNSLSEPLP